MNMIKILIAENVPSLNKGEIAILFGMLESFKLLGEVKLSMLSAYPDIDVPRYSPVVRVINTIEAWPLKGGLECGLLAKIFVSILVMLQHIVFIFLYMILGTYVTRLFKSEIWNEYLTTDVIIIGHNGTFGLDGALGIPFFYHIYIATIAKLLDKPVVLYGGSIPQTKGILGPIKALLYKLALKNICLVTLRERISCENLKNIGLRGKRIFITSDLAFLLQPAPLNKISQLMKQEGIEKNSKPLVGITATHQMASKAFPYLGSPLASYSRHIEMLAETIDKLIDSLSCTVIFVPHCIGFGDELDDRLVAKDILNKCKNKKEIKLIDNEYSAAELKGLIGQFDLFIGERTHSVVNAMSMRVPSVILSNSIDKRLDMIRMLGQDNAICYTDNLDSNSLLDKINNIWSNRDMIKTELKMQTDIAKEKAMLNGKLLKEHLNSE